MNKFKYGQEVLHILTGKKVRIKSVSTDHGAKHSAYTLENGSVVCEGQLAAKMPEKKTKKRKVIHPVAQADSIIKDEEVTKSEEIDFKENKD